MNPKHVDEAFSLLTAMACCGYLRFAGPAARNLLKRLGCAAVECCVRGSQRIRRKLVPKYACPCDLFAMMAVHGELKSLFVIVSD